MTHFELFGLEPKLHLDLGKLQSSYHELSRRFHPDFYTTSSVGERASALEMTARLNDAYRTLRDPTRRAEYLVKSHGLTVDSSKVPQSLLMEVFEINEAIQESRTTAGSDPGKVEEVRAAIEEKRDAFQQEMEHAFSEWDALVERNADEESRNNQLRRLAEILAQASYIRNLEAELNDEVTH